MRTRGNILSAMYLKNKIVDGQICGVVGQYHRHIDHLLDTLTLKEGIKQPAAISMVLSPKGPMFFCDTHINENPDAETLTQITLMAANVVKRFGLTPKIALLSHSNFGSRATDSSRKMQNVLEAVRAADPNIEIEGEMQPDLALWEKQRAAFFPNSALKGIANLFIFSNIDSANITYNFIKALTDSVVVAPILMGFENPVHVLTNAATSRRIVNLTAVCATEIVTESSM
jgi:malate dehydrogenase (oxaloacetate-decarboxylating)(NADP+)